MSLRGLLSISAIVAAVSIGTAFAKDPAECHTVRIADGGWVDNMAQNGLAMVALEALGYRVETQFLAVPIILESLKNRKMDVFLDFWSPSIDAMTDPYLNEGAIVKLQTNLTDARFTLAVPSYVWEGGLKDFADIAKFGDKLGYKIHGIEAGNDSNGIIIQMIESDAFGLGKFDIVESSEQGMLSAVARAEKRKDWIVFIAWSPHPMNIKHDIKYLGGGDDWFGPDYGSARVWTAVRNGFVEDCPNLGRFFRNLVFTVEMESTVMSYIEEGMDGPTAARKYLSAHPDVIGPWLEGVTTIAGEPGEPSVREALKH